MQANCKVSRDQRKSIFAEKVQLGAKRAAVLGAALSAHPVNHRMLSSGAMLSTPQSTQCIRFPDFMPTDLTTVAEQKNVSRLLSTQTAGPQSAADPLANLHGLQLIPTPAVLQIRPAPHTRLPIHLQQCSDYLLFFIAVILSQGTVASCGAVRPSVPRGTMQCEHC